MNPTAFLDKTEPMTKLCPKCHRRLPKSAFYEKGSACKRCDNSRPRNNTVSKAANHRARTRAYGRLVAAHPDEFKQLMADELANALAEAESLKAEAPPRSRRATETGPAHGRGNRCRPDPRRRRPMPAVHQPTRPRPRLPILRLTPATH